MELKNTYTSQIAEIFKSKETLKENWIKTIKNKIRLDDIKSQELSSIFDKAFKETRIQYTNSVQGKTRTLGALEFIYNTYKDEKIYLRLHSGSKYFS